MFESVNHIAYGCTVTCGANGGSLEEDNTVLSFSYMTVESVTTNCRVEDRLPSEVQIA